MKIKKAVKLVEETLPTKRYNHSIRVAETGKKMAEIFDGDPKKLSSQAFYMTYVNMKSYQSCIKV